ncbi:MAG: hypothetical protein GMKNLPBB_03033 [Myxococcota bacterium]|nr:hypothetical protein [Myxococcota bacterium]
MQTLGQYLREKREAAGKSVEDIHHETRISRTVLQSLETDDFENLPAGAYLKSFIQSYCQAVNADLEEALSRIRFSRRYESHIREVNPELYTPPLPHGRNMLFAVFVIIVAASLIILATRSRDSSGPGGADQPLELNR